MPPKKTKSTSESSVATNSVPTSPVRLPQGDKGRIFLIDAMSFIFRAYHAMARQRPMSTTKGVPTSATYVFVNMLRKLRTDFNPEYIAAVFDVGAKTFRDTEASNFAGVRKFDAATGTFQQVAYDGYKANRAEMPPDLSQQVPYIRRALDAYRIPILEMPGFEADDVIGTLACKAADAGYPVYVVSSDKDMLQLVNDHVCVLNPPKDNLICDRAKVMEILGVPPEKVVDVMALRGDTIDNIPGAPGIGDKGSVEIINQFGSVEAALERASELSKKTYRESLLNNREAVEFSKRMATIDCNVPVEFNPDAMIAREPDGTAARELFTELEFTSLVKEFLPTLDVGKTEYREARSPEDVQAVLNALPDGVLAVAIENAAGVTVSASEDEPADDADLEPAPSNGNGNAQLSFMTVPHISPLLGDVGEQPNVGIDTDEANPVPHISPNLGDVGRNIALSSTPGNAITVDLSGNAAAALKAALADASIPKAIHDYKSVSRIFRESGVQIAGVQHDPMLYSYLLDPTYSSHRLDEIALRRFNTKLGDGKGGGISLAEAADWTARISSELRKEVADSNLQRVYDHIDLPLVPVLAHMEEVGVKIDCNVLYEMSTRLDKQADAKARQIWELAGEQFNINSPKQLSKVLFENLHLPKPVKYGKGKTVSTAVDVLEGLAVHHEVPRMVLEYRQLTKLKSTYVDALPALLNQCTQRLHTTFDQTNTATGRLSSKNPNLQNIPIKTELGREIRAAFIAEPGNTFVSADYSQIELRLLAHFSQDPLLLEAFQRGDDIHTQTAATVFNMPPGDVTPEHRRRAKAINFGIPYGLSPFGLSQQLGIEPSEAKAYIDGYFEKYKGVHDYLEGVKAKAREEQKVSTLFGRIRPIPDINSKNANLRGFAERTAVNTPLQGTAADLIKIAMIHLDHEISDRNLRSRMTLQVHDELVFEVPDDELETMRTLIADKMENACALTVPLVVEIGVGKNWRDLQY